jgi:hypothetical protein
MISKNKLLVLSIVGSILFLVFLYSDKLLLCGAGNLSCHTIFDPLAEDIFIFVPLLLMSIVTFKMRVEIFYFCLRFVYIWIPLTLILTILVPEYSNSILPIEKGVISLFMSVLFFLRADTPFFS